MQEHEIWGVLTEKEYNEILENARKRFGKSMFKRRLAISYWNDQHNKNLDTRIRITNGEPEIMQKYGTWENEETVKMEEISVPLVKDTTAILNMYIVLDNAHPKATRQISQYENEIFVSDKVELKLTKQIGKETKYTFELELLDTSKELLILADELSLRDKITKTDVAFWEDWNRAVNIMTDEISLEEIKELIQKYLSL